MLVALTACAASPEAAERFVPIEDAVADWGDLELSHTALRLHAFEGQMDLQYAGRMPDSAGEELAGGTVYRIKNPDRYYRQNGQNTRLCAGPPRWVVVNSRTGAPAWSGEIWVALLTLEDWSGYSPGRDYFCGGGRYVRATE